MNSKNNKTPISLSIAILLVLAFGFGIYFVHHRIHSYRADVLDDYNTLAELQNEKDILYMYNKILLKGSKESMQIQSRILIDDRKQLLSLIDTLEDYTRKVGLVENNNSPVVSVATREDAAITAYNAKDVVIELSVLSGDEKKLDTFLDLINNLPLASYIEKINLNKSNATIILVLYQKNEVK